jgi:biotin transport system substrate-specific component
MAMERSSVSTWSRLEVLASPRARRIIGVISFAVLTALGAKVSLPIVGTAVPFTFQPLAVMLAGALLGARLGAASQITYLAAGLVGLPVFASGFLLSPSGGYLMAFPLAAFVVGAFAGEGKLRNLLALLAGLGVVYLGGTAWLATFTGWSAAVAAGVAPFIVADLVKVGMAWAIMQSIRRKSLSLFAA